MRWMFRPHVLQHRPATLSVFLALHRVQGKFLPPPVVFCCSTDSAQQVSAEGLLSKAELPSLQQALVPVFQGKAFFCCRHSLQLLRVWGVFALVMTAFGSGCSTLQPFQCPLWELFSQISTRFHQSWAWCVQGFSFCFSCAGEASLLLVLHSRVGASLLMGALLWGNTTLSVCLVCLLVCSV